MGPALLVSDFDGTLFRQGRVSGQDLTALRDWHAQGNLLAIATGRGFSSIAKALAHWRIQHDYLICVNGAEIYDGGLSLIHRKPFCIQCAIPVLEKLQCGATETVAIDGGTELVLPPGERLRGLPTTPVSQLAIGYCSANAASRAADSYGGDCADVVRVLRNGRWINVVASGVDKAAAVQVLQPPLCVRLRKIVAIGDDHNDIGMIAYYGGYAISASPAAAILAENNPKTCDSVHECIQIAGAT